MAPLVRLLGSEDEAALITIDRDYAEAFAVEPVIVPGCLSFFIRTGHAFVAEVSGTVVGFALAQVVWDGSRPTLQVRRMVATGEKSKILEALLAAITRSAYDSGVYDIELSVIGGDAAAEAALLATGFRRRPVVAYGRVLGSRGEG